MVSLAISHRLALVGERDHAGHRAEDLLPRRPIRVRDRGEHRGREPVAGAVRRRSTDRDRGVVRRRRRRPSRAGRRRSAAPSGSPRRAGRRLASTDIASSSASRKRSTTERSTRIRERAQQSWPALPNTASGAAAAARSRSASANTTLADLPPSSRVTRLIVAAAPSAIPRPTSVEPVKAIFATSGCSTSRRPQTLPGPATTLRTPSGRPASSAIRSSSSAVSGVSSAGFSTTVLPAASAGRDLPRGDQQREVPGHDQADHPERLAERHVDAAGDRDRLARAAAPGRRRSSGRSPRPSPSRRARRRSACRRFAPRAWPGRPLARRARRRGGASSAARSAGATARQAGKASFARATAASASSAPALAAPPPSPAPWRARRPRSPRAHPPAVAASTSARDRRRLSARPPRGARGRRARTDGPGARSPRSGRRSPTSRSPSAPRPAVDALVVVGLDRDSSAPTAVAASEPGSSRTSWSLKAPGRVAVVVVAEQRREGAGPGSPPRATFIICMPRQTPSTGIARSRARRTRPISKRSRSGHVGPVSGCGCAP